MKKEDVEKLKEMLRGSSIQEEYHPEEMFVKNDYVPRIKQTPEERDRIIKELKELGVVDTSLPPGSSLDDYQCIIDCVKEADSKFGSPKELMRKLKESETGIIDESDL